MKHLEAKILGEALKNKGQDKCMQIVYGENSIQYAKTKYFSRQAMLLFIKSRQKWCRDQILKELTA